MTKHDADNIAIPRQRSQGRPWARSAALASLWLSAGACGGAGTPRPAAPPTPIGGPRSTSGPDYDASNVFRRAGLIARGAPMPFVGTVAFFASDTPDSTHVVVAVSLSNASLTFARESDRFRAGYTITMGLRSGAQQLKQVEAHESVLVASFRETTRIDESILFEEVLTVSPGRYDFTVGVRDDGSAKQSEDAVTLVVPSVAQTGLSTPVSFARAGMRRNLAALPQVIINPTASATFGRDSVVPFMLEAYGASGGQEPVHFEVRTDAGRPIYRDSNTLPVRGQLHVGTVEVPLHRVAIGAMTLSAWRPGRSDTVRAPLFVGFGADLPLASYEEMINYLRWFAPGYRLNALRDTLPEHRPGAWAAFVKDYASMTGGNDALREYFARMLEANNRFREETMPGWQTDRGRVLLGLGRPDQVYEQPSRALSQQGRTQLWEYRNQSVVLTFYDQNGFGRWRLTTVSETDFMNAWRRRVR
ncbi:MAG: GWxTD domain-containing protein [Gemmatimonadetes bacterium]|nr:GWxTD domain-containing protein [Gemmatimonadota bacterium]